MSRYFGDLQKGKGDFATCLELVNLGPVANWSGFWMVVWKSDWNWPVYGQVTWLNHSKTGQKVSKIENFWYSGRVTTLNRQNSYQSIDNHSSSISHRVQIAFDCENAERCDYNDQRCQTENGEQFTEGVTLWVFDVGEGEYFPFRMLLSSCHFRFRHRCNDNAFFNIHFFIQKYVE